MEQGRPNIQLSSYKQVAGRRRGAMVNSNKWGKGRNLDRRRRPKGYVWVPAWPLEPFRARSVVQEREGSTDVVQIDLSANPVDAQWKRLLLDAMEEDGCTPLREAGVDDIHLRSKDLSRGNLEAIYLVPTIENTDRDAPFAAAQPREGMACPPSIGKLGLSLIHI